MSGCMTDSAQVQRINAQLERGLHKPSGRRGCVIFEVAGTCELQGIDGRSFYAKREDLNNTETWERLP